MSKIFCISFQRTGTTSVGQFFKDHGYLVATNPVSRANDWTLKWFSGDYEGIFKSDDFRRHQVFEDDPWFCGDLYKVLFHRFPDSRFVLFERDPDKWFDSMVSHSNGKTLGNTHRHAYLYRRELEFYRLNNSDGVYSKACDNLLPLGEAHRRHYKEIYELKNLQVKEFFSHFDPSRLFMFRLEDPSKWAKLGENFGLKVSETYEAHSNKTPPKKARLLSRLKKQIRKWV